MSKEAQYELEIENTSRTILEKAIGCLCKELKAQKLNVSQFRIYGNRQINVQGICVHIPGMAYPVDVYVDQNKKLVVNGDSMDIRTAGQRVQQFYAAMEYSMAHHVPMEYNKKTREVEMLLEV